MSSSCAVGVRYAPVWDLALERVVAMRVGGAGAQRAGGAVLRTAMDDLRRPRRTRVGLDLDLGVGELATPGLVAGIASVLEGVDPSLVCLSVPLSDALALGERARRLLGALRGTGVRLAVDGLGWLHGARDLLARLPVQALRVAPDLLARAATDRSAAGMARALASLGWSLDLVTVAPGATSTADLRHARDLGFDRVEGAAVRAAAPSWPAA